MRLIVATVTALSPAHSGGRFGDVFLNGLKPGHRKLLEAVGNLDHLAHERHLLDTLEDAVTHARVHLANV